ncbi:hypothetical protein CLU79DRAFT_779185 [Phycomyces nitens]|nr:hypothetical protein CLU79DRAFT_779185 [Phycomyces nitens]
MRLGKLVKDAQSLAKDGQLDPCNLVQRCHFSAIFSPLELDDPKLAALSPLHVDLPESIYQNIRVLRCSLATKDLFIPPCKSSSFQEHNLNSIVSAIYAIHGRRQIKHKGSELSHIVKPVSIFLEPFFSAHDDVQIEWDTMSMAYKNVNDCEKLRPDIILHTICNDMIVEIP